MRKSLKRASSALGRRMSAGTQQQRRVQSVVKGTKPVNAGDPECKICGDLLGQEACRTACGHKFCRSCMERLLRAPSRTFVCETCQKPVTYSSVVWEDIKVPIKDKDATTIFGMTFIQFGSLGLESIHFDRDRCYLLYDPKVIPSKWRLEDGQRLPPRKAFSPGWTYDARTREFRGTVDWTPNSFRGVQRMEYKLKFDESLELISEGEVLHFRKDGYFRARHFGGNKLKNLHYRRHKLTVFGNSYVRVPSPEENEMADKIVKSLGSLGSWGLGISTSAVETMLWNELPLIHFGCFSLHFGKARSYVDVSMIEGYHPSRFYFENFKFFPETRTFKGEIRGDAEYDLLTGRSTWILHFDETLDRIVWGKIKHYGLNGQVEREELCGWDNSGSQRYLLVAPWQTLDDPDAANRYGALEELLK